MIAFKGATAYEWQIGRLYGRITHLRGDYWKYRPWRRLSFGWDRSIKESNHGT